MTGLSLIFLIVSILFTLPVLIIGYYYLVQFFCALRYPRSHLPSFFRLEHFPLVSILIATYNEKYVIQRSLDALKNIDYPREKIQLIIADDSTDETQAIIDEKCEELRCLGLDISVSRRPSRTNFKSGALNQVSNLLRGDYVFLLDSDSVVPSEALQKGLSVFMTRSDISFISFRVGHYNREESLITRLYALPLDLGDTLGKMGAYLMNLPFSFQGGFVLISKSSLEEVGYWSNSTIVEDADLSCKLYVAGKKGIYLSDVKILSEDPPSFNVWKKQTARVVQGWAKCLINHSKTILRAEKMSRWNKMVLLLALLSPVASLSWIVTNFISSFSIVAGISTAETSIFSNPVYIAVVSTPGVAILIAAIFALHVQRIMTPRNLALIPFLPYVGLFMLTTNSVGFINSLLGQTGFFYRTPKRGQYRNEESTEYLRTTQPGMIGIVEIALSSAALVLSILVLTHGVLFLALSLFCYSVLTLKSMNLTVRERGKKRENERSETVVAPPIIAQSK